MSHPGPPVRFDYPRQIKAAMEDIMARGEYPSHHAIRAEIGGGTMNRVREVRAALVVTGAVVVTVPKGKPGMKPGTRRAAPAIPTAAHRVARDLRPDGLDDRIAAHAARVARELQSQKRTQPEQEQR